MNKFLIFVSILFMASVCSAQQTFPYNGVLPKDVVAVAFTHATIYIDFKNKIEDATLVIEKGKVVAAGKDIKIPSNAVTIDLKGKFIYPSFIDLYSDWGMSGSALPGGPGTMADMDDETIASKGGTKGVMGWNPAIKVHNRAALLFAPAEESAKELRAIGMGVVLSQKMDGIARGTSALFGLSSQPNKALIRPDVAAHYSFNKGTSDNPYPSSLMGCIALLRQTYCDAIWYKNTGYKDERNLSLESFNSIQNLPSIFEANDKWNILRADKVGDEFGVQYIFKTNGNEYQRLKEIKDTKGALIVPLTFPDAWDVSDPYLARMVGLDEMKHWELAPANCGMLAKENITFAITAYGLQDKSMFLKNLRKAIAAGLSESDALKALTLTPAQLVKSEKEIGSLDNGKWANFFISSKNIFTEGAVIYENWVQGERFTIETMDKPLVEGMYKLGLPKTAYELQVSEADGKVKADIKHYFTGKKKDGSMGPDTLSYPATLAFGHDLMTLTFEPKDEFYSGIIRLSGNVDRASRNWNGRGQESEGAWIDWSALRTGDLAAKKVLPDSAKTPEVRGEIIYPFVAYGWTSAPKAETVLIKNATVWTCDTQGKIENGEVLISGGKIVAVGQKLDVSKYPGAVVIDAKGKHVTPGIIDEHSHIALASVNEGAQSSSAEVEEASVVWPEDIDIYRQLSGGVTAAQLLHGSANAIGGQSALVKMRWGVSGSDMLIKDAPKFIKFALGENVKQANWGSSGSRFPQTRMGVEQLYYDHFIRAREYGEAWKAFKTAPKAAPKKGMQAVTLAPPRRDIELETLYEILTKERFITCHSYVQSEINMLMHVADSMNFTLNTFTHILEGYKVADKMKAHGAGASSFSDWWAYKYEVKDAIPHNGALLWERGVVVAFNSDDAEMARRLNQEAGKAIKYGGVPETEALKFVTLNPAKLLHLDKKMGSLTVGKDADLVIWSDHPLSIYAKAEKTFVDGICYFDIQNDAQMRIWIEKERARLIQKMLNAKKAGAPVQQPVFKTNPHFHCDTMDQTSLGIGFK
jgi:imidazolonepropionase-like amidohydrolase